MSEPDRYLSDRIPAEYEGEEITIWNRVRVHATHQVRVGEIESYHKLLAGDGSTGEEPEYITPEMDDQLRALDVYPSVTVLDPRDDEVTLL